MNFAENIETQFEQVEKDKGNLSTLRQKAFSSFQKLGIPGNRHEEWRYTHIKTQLPETLSVTPAPAQAQITIAIQYSPDVKETKLVFVNGTYAPELSQFMDEKQVTVGNLAKHVFKADGPANQYYNQLVNKYEEHFSTLNTAFATDGAFIHIKKGAKQELPVFVINLYNSPENFVQSRTLIIAEESSSANIIFDFQCFGASSFVNHVSEIFCANNSAVEVTQLQTATQNATIVNTLEAEIGRDALFTCNTLTFEGKLVRNTTNVRLSGQNTEAHLNGLYYAKGDSLIDNHILVDHMVPNCQSNQLYKGIIDDDASGVFNGKIYVKKDAQKTNAFQSSKAILLSDNAPINSKPQLEIFADDVKCSHGATTGQLNDEEIFYLRARGIEEAEAKGLLTYAFASQIISKMTDGNIKVLLDNILKERLNLNF